MERYHCRLLHVMGNGLSRISSCWTELSESFSTCWPYVLYSVARVFNSNKTSFLTGESRGASGFYCVKLIEEY
jgi:hypothetical protein